MTDKNFQRAWKYWNPKKPYGKGFEGGHHDLVKSESNFVGYIDKEKNPWFEYNHKYVQEPQAVEDEEESSPPSEGSVEV